MEVRSSQNMTTSYFIIIILFEKTKYRIFFNIQFSENHCLNSKALLNDLLTLTDFNICWKQWFQVENKQKKPYKKIALYNSFCYHRQHSDEKSKGVYVSQAASGSLLFWVIFQAQHMEAGYIQLTATI